MSLLDDLNYKPPVFVMSTWYFFFAKPIKPTLNSSSYEREISGQNDQPYGCIRHAKTHVIMKNCNIQQVKSQGVYFHSKPGWLENSAILCRKYIDSNGPLC